MIGIMKRCTKKVVGKALLNYDKLKLYLLKLSKLLSDEHNDEAITPSHLLYGRNVSKRNIMHIDYREQTAENTQQQYKRMNSIYIFRIYFSFRRETSI